MHTSRTRCGNQVSEVPRTPIAPGEPTPETLTTPLPIDTLEPPLEFVLESPRLPGILPPEGDTGEAFIPPVVPIIVGGGTPPSGPIIPPPVRPPTPAPEPATLLLTATGLSSVWIAHKLRKS